MSLIAGIIAEQERYKERLQEIETGHATILEAIESRFRREQGEPNASSEGLEMSVQSRQDLLHMAEEWLRNSKLNAMQERDEALGQFIN